MDQAGTLHEQGAQSCDEKIRCPEMRVYRDTSVVLRRLFNELKPVSSWGKWEEAYASRIWLTEAGRTIDRLRLEAASKAGAPVIVGR